MKTILKAHWGLRNVKSRLVPKTLNFLEKSRLVDVYETMISYYQDKLKCIITADEIWIYAYDPETNEHDIRRAKGEAGSKRVRQSHSKMKLMMTVFFDFRCVVLHEIMLSENFYQYSKA